MSTKTKQSSAQVHLALTKWELTNLHLPPVTTVTLYSGTAPVQFLRDRIALILAKNPWLASRIVKKSTADDVVAMAYDEDSPQVDEHFKAYEPGEVGLSLDMQYAELFDCVLPLQCARSKPATDANEPLFKVAVVPLEVSTGSTAPAPMDSAVTFLDLAENHAGNYEANVPYLPGDIEEPALIRQSILSPEKQFRARRAGSPATEVPGFLWVRD